MSGSRPQDTGPEAQPDRGPEPAIRVSGLVKQFRHRAEGPRTFRHWVESGFARARRDGSFRALDGVDFEVRPGEMLGVIGHNGSGKSTLLRCLGGVMAPDAGTVALSAPVTGILELNAGMHPDLSGRENIVINAVLSGLLRAEAEAIVEEVIDFAEIREHIDNPVRTYSAGMRLRLGFAVAVHVDPKIVLIDEVLAVGDLAFQAKCLERIEGFKRAGAAIVLISHDAEQIATYCDRALWLERGRVRALGQPAEVIRRYRGEMMRRSHGFDDRSRDARRLAGGEFLVPGENWTGSQEMTLAGVRLTDGGGAETAALAPGGALGIELLVGPGARLPAHVSISLVDPAGRMVFETNTERDRVALPLLAEGDRLRLELGRLDLAPGDYRLTVGLWPTDWNHAYDLHEGAYRFEVPGAQVEGPRFAPPRHWRLLTAPGPDHDEQGAPIVPLRKEA